VPAGFLVASKNFFDVNFCPFVLKQKNEKFKAVFYFSVHQADNFYATIALAVSLEGYCFCYAKIIRMQDEKLKRPVWVQTKF
jgi:hypothetical protein